MTQKIAGDVVFGLSVIPSSQIFLLRKNVFGIVNHRPFVEGHVLVCSRRQIGKFQDLTQIQSIDLFMTAQEVCKQLQIKYKTQYEIFMQNGKDAGQTVNHVHLHLMPKYQNIEALEKKNSEIRTQDDMARQAEIYRGYFSQSSQ